MFYGEIRKRYKTDVPGIIKAVKLE